MWPCSFDNLHGQDDARECAWRQLYRARLPGCGRPETAGETPSL